MRHLRILTLLTAATIAPVLLLTACSTTTPTSRDADAAEASKLPADDTGASSVEPQANGTESPSPVGESTTFAIVQVYNGTNREFILGVEGVDNYDWNSPRPDHPAPEGFDGVELKPGESVSRTLGKNRYSNGAPFVLTFIDDAVGVVSQIELDTKLVYMFDPAHLPEAWGLRNGAEDCPLQPDSVVSGGFIISIDCQNGGFLGNTPVSDVVICDPADTRCKKLR